MNLDKIDAAIEDVRHALDLLAKHEHGESKEEKKKKVLTLTDAVDVVDDVVRNGPSKKPKLKKSKWSKLNKMNKESELVKEPAHKIIHLKVKSLWSSLYLILY